MRTKPSRTAFTLIELLVVLAIISILIVMTAGTAMRVMGSQKAANTETTIKKVEAAVLQHMDAVKRQAEAEFDTPPMHAYLYGDLQNPNPQARMWGVLRMAGFEPAPADPQIAPLMSSTPTVDQATAMRRAKLIWVKLRLKQQFPMSFAEALCPTPRFVAGVPFYMNPGTQPLPWVLLPPEPAYCQALLGTGTPFPPWWIKVPAQIPPAPARAVPLAWESGTMLHLALTLPRRGISSTLETFAASETIETPLNGLRCLADGYGMPLMFFRWAVGEPIPAISAAPPVGDLARLDPHFNEFQKPVPNLRNHDPLDPDGLLVQPNWNNISMSVMSRHGGGFEMFCNPIHVGLTTSGPSVYTPRSYFLAPVIASAGANRDTDDYLVTDVYHFLGRAPLTTNPRFQPTGVPLALLPELLDLTTPNTPPATVPANPTFSKLLHSPKSDDNVYSFRLRLGTRGD
jgi:prepilin-type N-terminal cleavage/methylation domain-containing protein